MTLKQIDHSSANWDSIINENFNSINVKSGAVSLPVLAPFTGLVTIYSFSNQLFVTATVKLANDTVSLDGNRGTIIAKIPTNLFTLFGNNTFFFLAKQDGVKNYAQMAISSAGNISIYNAIGDLTTLPVRFNPILPAYF